jgi:RNA polymerase sigma-70 factor (ECF subfamily)
MAHVCNAVAASGQYGAVSDGEQREFERLWALHHRRVLAYALRRTDRVSAEDVVSETFLTAWRRRHEMPAHELPWLLGVARLVLANHARSRRRRDALAQVLIDQAASARRSAAEVDRELLHALAALDPDDREALILVGWDGLRPAEAARVLGCAPGTFRVRLLRARRRLRALLARRAEAESLIGSEKESPA